MIDRKTLAFIGAGVAAVGTFLPIVSMPFIGNINYFGNGDRDGVFIVGLAVVTAILAGLEKYRWIFASAGISAVIVAYSLTRFANIEASMAGGMPDNPFAAGLAKAMAGSVQMQWGWIVIIAGIAAQLYAAWRDPRGTVDEI